MNQKNHEINEMMFCGIFFFQSIIALFACHDEAQRSRMVKKNYLYVGEINDQKEKGY